MITEIKEIKKELNAALKHFKNALELTKSNTIIGEIYFPGTSKVRKPRKLAAEPVDSIPEKKPTGRRAKKLLDLDEKGYMKDRLTTEE